MLIGIVKKNAIMMIDFALDKQRREGRPAREAIYEACVVRFRPIMMTTMSALMGTLPIALGWGAGASARRGLGLAVVGGLIVSQVLTLYLTPVVYLYFERFQEWFRRAKAESPENYSDLALTVLKQLKLDRQILLRVLAKVVEHLHAFGRKVVDV